MGVLTKFLLWLNIMSKSFFTCIINLERRVLILTLDVGRLLGRPFLNGERFEKIMNGLPHVQRTPETASAVMLVATVTDMKNTVVEDLASESESRQRNADNLQEDASQLRQQADSLDLEARGLLVRRSVVEGLRAFLNPQLPSKETEESSS